MSPGTNVRPIWESAAGYSCRTTPIRSSRAKLGYPGFLCFVGTLLLSIKYALSDYRRNRERDPVIAQGSLYMFVCLVGLAAGIFFLSVGYGMLPAVLFGLAASLNMAASSEKQVEQTALTQSEPVLDAPRTLENRPKMQGNLLNGRRVRFGRFAGRGADSLSLAARLKISSRT